MKTPLFLCLAALLCASVSRAELFRPETVNGAVIGGVAGAIIGNNSGHGNAVRGAVIGGLAGGLIGSAVADSHDHRRGYYSPRRDYGNVRIGVGVGYGSPYWGHRYAYRGGYHRYPYSRYGFGHGRGYWAPYTSIYYSAPLYSSYAYDDYYVTEAAPRTVAVPVPSTPAPQITYQPSAAPQTSNAQPTTTQNASVINNYYNSGTNNSAMSSANSLYGR
ncbi:MAG TPA: YMGG-like glycine zipper-containing protein [Opitutaceae bacterium]|nr:YMGG-like glycine zipper-containing protein [Opitutaceae bacterium]